MATKTGTPQHGHAQTAILEQLATLSVRTMEPEIARSLLEFKFDSAQHERVKLLSEKAQQGTLTTNEQSELDEYIRVGTLLGILQSRARQVLKNLEQAP
jgi:hypothetical protein